MGGGVSPRVTYWTGTWDPAKEAISKEIAVLRAARAQRCPVISLSQGQATAVDLGNSVLRVSARHFPVLRMLAPLLERQGDVTHVFGSLNSWHLLRCTGRRPTLLTVALSGQPADAQIHAHVRMFAVESERLAEELRRTGIPDARVRLVYPGVDLQEYRPGLHPPPAPFRLLFASSPADAEEFNARGIPLLVDAARLLPDIEVVLLWREWGDQSAALRALDELRPPSNVRIEYLAGRHMSAVYQSVHAVACVYAEGFGKSCPNSLVEGLACGVPVIVADTCGIASLVAHAGAGIAVPRDPRHLAAAVIALRSAPDRYAMAARALAEARFDYARFLSEYADLYREVCHPFAGQATVRRLRRFASHPASAVRSELIPPAPSSTA